MANRNLDDLYMPLKTVVVKALEIAKVKNLGIIITCTKRSQLEQLALFAQGREELKIVNYIRNMIRMPLIPKGKRLRKVTWTMNTYHATEPFSMAFDFCIKDGRMAIWDVKADVNNNDVPDYEEFADICKEIDPDNIEWGGDWKKKDYAHIQWKGGREFDQYKELYEAKKLFNVVKKFFAKK